MNQALKCKHVVLGILGLTLMANTVKGDWVAGTQRCTTPDWAATRTNVRKSLIGGDGVGVNYYETAVSCYSGANPFKWRSAVDYPNDNHVNNGTSTTAPIGFAY